MIPTSERPTRRPPGTLADYRHFQPVTTRWNDNDPYGHANNVIYHSWFDTAVNRFLIERGLLDVRRSGVIAVTAENGCHYHSAIAYPDAVTIGIRAARLGGSSVRYESAAFRDGAEAASAEGYFVHVYVDRTTMRPVPIPADVRAGLQSITV